MGVWGLQGFLKNNPHITERIELNNTSLVIDARNLMCCLYFKMTQRLDSVHYRSDLYGGDMVAYGEIVKGFFHNLEMCSIVPILVLDGAGSDYQRGLDRFEAAKTATEDATDDKIIMSIAINHVFKNVISELGIKRVQALSEADSHIARIANNIGCPVLTNDSDFIIYKLQVGFIMFDQFNYQNIVSSRDGTPSIAARLYSQVKFVKCLPGLRAENLALLSVLLESSFVEASTFDAFLRSICNRYHNNDAFLTETFSHRRIAWILTWLSDKTLSQAIEIITGQLDPDSRQEVEQKIQILLKRYNIEETDNFDAVVEDYLPSGPADPKTDIGFEIKPAQYLRRLMETSDLSSRILDIVFGSTYYNYPIIDDFRLPSSSCIRYRPFSVLVTLLRPISYLGMSADERQEHVEIDSFLLYDRVSEEYADVTIKPIEELDGFGSLEHLDYYTCITLGPSPKKSLLMATFRFNTDEMNSMNDTLSQVFADEMTQESSICFLLVKYIAIETKTAPRPQFADALMLTLFFYAAKGGHLNRNLLQDPASYEQLMLLLKPHTIKRNGKNYQSSHTLFRRINHFISQLQYALISYCLLNSFLDHVFQVPRFETYLNGTLIFRLTKMFTLGELKLDTICDGIKPLLDTRGSIRVMVNCDKD